MATDDAPSNPPAALVAADPEDGAEQQSVAGDDDLESEGDFQSTASITSSILDFRKLHGRTFGNSKTTEYWGPNDDLQNEGLDITHHFMLLYFRNKLFHAPISDNPQKVLDVGTGTGIWAIDFADQYPSAHIIGTDISPIQPSWVPPNCEFHIDDAQLDWTWSENTFDYIHMRDLYGSIGDWPALYKKAYNHLKPGGWFEDSEIDITCRSDVVGHDPKHIYNVWTKTCLEAGDKAGKTLQIAMGSRMSDYLKEAGFINRFERRFRIPIGPWCRDPDLKQVGQFSFVFVDQSLEGFAIYLLTQVMGWEYEECLVFIAQMRDAIRNYKTLHPYWEINLVYGQKPETGAASAAA